MILRDPLVDRGRDSRRGGPALRLAEHLWQKTQQAPHPALGQVGGGYDEGEPVLIDALPYSVQSLIEDHAVLGFA